MEKKKVAKIFVSLIIFLVFNLALISAGVTIPNLEDSYNLGSQINEEVSVSDYEQGFFKADLVCGSQKLNVYNSILNKKAIDLILPLTPDYIGNLKGDCYIEFNYGKSSEKTNSFLISDLIKINIEADRTIYDPDTSVRVKGTALKENGEILESREINVEVYLDGSLKDKLSLEGSNFNINFTLDKKIKSGKHIILIKVFDLDISGNKLNKGENSITIEVNQKPTKIDIALNKQSLNPSEPIEIISTLYDQAGDKIKTELELFVEDVNGIKILETQVSSGEKVSYEIKEMSDYGIWEVGSFKREIESKRSFEVNQQEKITAEIYNSTLVITNKGNIDYQKDLDIKIGDKINQIKDLNLRVGESKSFKLSASTGEHQVEILSGQSSILKQTVPLTGKSISVKEIGTFSRSIFNYSIIWILIILIILGIIFMLYLKSRSGKSDKLISPENQVSSKQEIKKKNTERTKREDTIKKIENPEYTAEQVLVLDGQKQKAAVMSIKINTELSDFAQEKLDSILKIADKYKGAIYKDKKNILIIFSPLLSRTFKNEENAVKCALKIEKELKEYNSKFKDKINFGIGINVGEIINKKDKEVLKFTSLGTTVALSKKIAEIAKQKMYISKEIHERTLSSIKSEKKEDKEAEAQKIEVFEVTKIIDRDQNIKFIQGFLSRNK